MRTIFLIAFLSAAIVTPANSQEFMGRASTYIEDKVFTCPNSGLKFEAPDLKSEKYGVQYRTIAPGITWSVMFTGTDEVLATVTYTKIRKEYPKTDELLGRTAANLKGIALQERGYLEWCGFLTEEKGKPLQCIIRFPNAGRPHMVHNKWKGKLERVGTDVLAIRHYLVRDGHLLEFNIYIPRTSLEKNTDEQTTEDMLIDQWSEALGDFVMGCSLVKKDDSYIEHLKTFNRPKTYFRFSFKDPSME